MTTRRPDNLKAFTLLELILVLVIITVMVGMAAPQLSTFVRGQGAGNTAAQIASLAYWARSQAIAQGTCYRLNVNHSEGTFWVTAQGAGGFHIVASTLGAVFRVPDGLTLEAQITQLSPAPDADKTALFATFTPDGRVDPGTIRVIDGKSVIEVTCLSATEDYRVMPAAKGGP